MAKSDSDSTTVIYNATTDKVSKQAVSINYDWRKLQPLVRPAITGLVCALLLVGVVAGFSWGQTISADSGNTGSIASAWSIILYFVTIVVGIVAAIGVPFWLSMTRGRRAAVTIIAFELIFLTIALVISGYLLFSGSNSNSTGNNQVDPGGPSCSESVYGC